MKLISKKDIVIPKGTIFENIDGETTAFINDNYLYYLALDNDTTARIIVSKNDEYFKEVNK